MRILHQSPDPKPSVLPSARSELDHIFYAPIQRALKRTTPFHGAAYSIHPQHDRQGDRLIILPVIPPKTLGVTIPWDEVIHVDRG